MFKTYQKICNRTAILLVFFLLLFIGAAESVPDRLMQKKQNITTQETVIKREIQAGVVLDLRERLFDTGIISKELEVVYLTPEEEAEKVYTFLQGPRAFSESLPWSGDWCQKIVRHNSFGGFGCGLCCMANIYSTLTPYECSPWDMYEYATQATLYYPTKESGAIGWDDMKQTLASVGFTCENCSKPATYEEFQEQMTHTDSAIVLVSSGEDDMFWKDTEGHYVNIWLYQKDSDMVFLAEPGDPENNRTWIPLRYVYDALKTVSQYQYLTVTAYAEESNQWKWNGIDDVWNGKF